MWVRKNIFRRVTFQNLGYNSYNARHEMHLQVDHPSQKSNPSDRLTHKIAMYTIILNDTKITYDTSFIVLIIGKSWLWRYFFSYAQQDVSMFVNFFATDVLSLD
jgi:hypothetical protein